MKIGKKIPAQKILITGDRTVQLADYVGKPLVLFFYPRANTSGCTQEGLDFKAAIYKFRRQSSVILGASRDTLKAQENFKAKYEFPFELIADPDEVLCEAFEVMKMKNMYGKKVRGIERSTFLFDKAGKLAQQWSGVKVKGHVDEVLAAVKALKTAD